MAKKIAIIGTAPSSRLLAPFNDPEWEIWVCGPANMSVLPRFDVWFEIHSLNQIAAPSWKPYIEFLAKQPKVYMQEHYPEYPGSVKYPLEEMLAEYGPYFFTSSVAYMLALAIKEQPEVIGLWGVDMTATEEYADQRPGCQHFIDLALRKGIEIEAPGECDILQPPSLYGWNMNDPMYVKLEARRNEIDKKHRDARMRKRVAEQEELVYKGALQDIDYMLRTWTGKLPK